MLILLLGVGGAWLWQNPGFLRNALHSVLPGPAGPATEGSAIAALQDRVTRLEQRPPTPDMAQVTQRLDALESQRAAGGSSGGPTSSDLRSMLARLDVLEARVRATRTAGPVGEADGSAGAGSFREADGGAAPLLREPDLRPVLARLDALEKQQAAEGQQAQRAVDPARVDALTSRVDAMAARDPGADLRGKLDDVDHRLTELHASDAKLAGTSVDAARLGRLSAAGIALASGRPLGPIPDAPPALAKYATQAPPTEPALRLAFPPAMQAALKVSSPDTAGKPFLDRVMARLEGSRLITVREGDRVVVGNSTAAELGLAATLLNAGDLAGAVRSVDKLTGPPAEKMAPWLADAKALLAAREALVSLSEQP